MKDKKVLLADDVELFLELEKTFFRREDIEILVARNGKEALESVRENRPDMVFLDLYMPEMNGDECCRLIKTDPELKDTPVVMVTHGGREEDLQSCRDAGCDEIVLKPINRHHFLKTARELLKLSDRAAPRVKARLQIHFGSNAENLLSNYTVNLSTGGVFIETEQMLPVDTPLSVKFDLPERDYEIHCWGRVAWVNHPERMIKPQLPAGMGLQFLNLSLEDLDAIREYVKGQCLSPSW